MRLATAIVLILLSTTAYSRAAESNSAGSIQGMVKLKLDGDWIEGRPLDFSARQVLLLGRDGRLWDFAPDRAADYRKTSDRFRPYSPSEIRAELLLQLGREFAVTGTNHYMVAHLAAQRDKWAGRFEELYRSFVHYFSVRGLKPQTPEFPLIGIVCRNQVEFKHVAAEQGFRAPDRLAGYYSAQTNRITLYDMQADDGSHAWQENASVIIHEATHQTAFNTGVHNRFAPTPLWVAEGLATMFEAPGVYDSRYHTTRESRINRRRFDDFAKLVEAGHRHEIIKSLVAGDELFRAAPGVAYAEAWALTFYLAETQPRKYVEYLSLMAARPSFTEYSSQRRVADFTSIFGDDWRMLEARLLRFIAGLK